MKNQILLFLGLFTLIACSPRAEQPSKPVSTEPVTTISSTNTIEPMEIPSLSSPENPKFVRGNIFIEESGLLIRESYPPQISLNISGNLPTPCHQFRADVSKPDTENKINVDVYTVVNPDVMCIQVLKEFTESINLGTYPSGHYTVLVNGQSVGEFDS